MAHRWLGNPRGILRHDWEERDVWLGRHAPTGGLAQYIEYYWTAHWDLRGKQPRVEESLPHPCVHIVFEDRKALVYGVMRGRFVRHLSDIGEIFAIKFRPGGFSPFGYGPLSQLTDRVVSASDIFGESADLLVEQVCSAACVGDKILKVERFLADRAPSSADESERVTEIVEKINNDARLQSVSDLASSLKISARTLQRKFKSHVGVGPKWVIQRYRLHEAVDQITKSRKPNYARIAIDLGYADQAHLIHDFKRVVGSSPRAYSVSRHAEAAQLGKP